VRVVAVVVVVCVFRACATRPVSLSPLPIHTHTLHTHTKQTQTPKNKTHQSVTRSPIYAKFSEALAGVATIRAYGLEAYFTSVSDAHMRDNAWAYITQRAAASWLAMRLDVVGITIIALAGVLCVQGALSPGLAGLALAYALDMTRFLKHGVAMASKTESDFNSVERVVQYLRPEPEAAADTAPDVLAALPPDWPAQGAISVSKLSLRYRPGLPLVLRGVSFEVAGGEKVGLVGRTGSGKVGRVVFCL
jgi:ATP-binding cassette subfamily C (CFTR/MRP) protein 1